MIAEAGVKVVMNRNRVHRKRMVRGWILAAFALLLGGLSRPSFLLGERLPNNGWEVLAVGFPADRDVQVVLGGAERTLTSKGLCEVRWENNSATLRLKLENLPRPDEIGWTGTQYVLWAVDNEKRSMNLGTLQMNGQSLERSLQVPFRTFGLLVTAEKDTQASVPSTNVAMESLLPTDPRLVVPVFRVKLSLAP